MSALGEARAALARAGDMNDARNPANAAGQYAVAAAGLAVAEQLARLNDALDEVTDRSDCSSGYDRQPRWYRTLRIAGSVRRG